MVNEENVQDIMREMFVASVDRPAWLVAIIEALLLNDNDRTKLQPHHFLAALQAINVPNMTAERAVAIARFVTTVYFSEFSEVIVK